MSNLRLGLIMLLHPGYKLIANTFCDVSCLEGCTVSTSGNNSSHEQVYCFSNNGNDVYKVPMYAKICSNKKKKYVRYKTEYYEQANDIYQLILARRRLPIEKGIK